MAPCRRRSSKCQRAKLDYRRSANLNSRYPKSPLIKRNGEVDAWDNAEFRAALKATGKKQVILGGIVTDVCEYINSNMIDMC